ncbi:hypothetical protein ABT369_38825 [Dactylosporangium sp. NPDC000244]|uniref:hypothetical protein n=1 Tax=Dactylosporangium sp. NPDC000244 TaxID=3154365 RepID=UPI0033202CCE
MSIDAARVADAVAVGASVPMPGESAAGTTRWQVERWDQEQTGWAARRLGLVAPGARQLVGADFRALRVAPYLATEVVGNLITNAGWTRLMNLLTNQGATQALDATHARVGVGNGTTPAEAYADTDLAASAGSSNRWFQLVSSAGTLGTRTLTFSATFGTSDGNFSWNEFGIDFGTASGNTVTAPLLNHKVGIAQGSKVSGQTWTATATLTFS